MGFAVAAGAAVLAVAGCGDSSPEAKTETVTVQSPAPSAASSSPALKTQGGVSPNDGQPEQTQTVAGKGFTARITVKDEPKRYNRASGPPVIAFPVSIDVQSGSMQTWLASWHLITVNGRDIAGNSFSSLPDAMGEARITQHAEGLIPFPATSDSEFADSVSLSRIEFRKEVFDETPATWEFTDPIKVAAIPVAKAE